MIIVFLLIVLVKYALMFIAAAAVSSALGMPLPSGWAILAVFAACTVFETAISALHKKDAS